MKEYRRHLDTYSSYPFSSFSKLVSEHEWGNKVLAEEYLQKYWLPEEEYLAVWKDMEYKIFQNESLPGLVFKPDFQMVVLQGGCLFQRHDFLQLQNIMLTTGEEYFVVIQHTQDFTEGEPMFRMKYPVNITWEELISGNYISAVLLEMNYNQYHVWGSNGEWGKYSANDYDYPLDIIGFKPQLTATFMKHLKLSKSLQDDVRGWLPPLYKNLAL